MQKIEKKAQSEGQQNNSILFSSRIKKTKIQR
jgi:hypothetical protein